MDGATMKVSGLSMRKVVLVVLGDKWQVVQGELVR